MVQAKTAQSTGYPGWSILYVMATLAVVGGPVRGQNKPYVGIIIDAKVAVHSGAGTNFYILGQLGQGDLVQVEKEYWSWYKIAAPEGTYSFISQDAVDANSDGKGGIVNQDHSPVTAANPYGPDTESYRVQIYLNIGATVQIAAKEADFYKIVPPKGASVYLPPRSVRRATNDEISGLNPQMLPKTSDVPSQEMVDITSKPSSKPETEPELKTAVVTEPKPKLELDPENKAKPQPELAPVPKTTLPTQPKSSVTPNTTSQGQPSPPNLYIDPMPKANAAVLQKLEQQAIESLGQPLEDQSLESLLAAYNQIQADPHLSNKDRRIIRIRISQIQRNRELAKTLSGITQLRRQMAQLPVELQDDLSAAPSYVAVGQLLASAVYNGHTLPRLLRLVEPSNGRTIAYLARGADSDFSNHLGKIVGVVGVARNDPDLKIKIIKVKQLDLFEAAQHTVHLKNTASTPPVPPIQPNQSVSQPSDSSQVTSLAGDKPDPLK